jgi:hypothetical protein
LINSFAVKQNRDQQLMRREKTDPIDCAAIGDLLRRGEGTAYQPAIGLYLQLQQLDRLRLSKVKIETMLTSSRCPSGRTRSLLISTASFQAR